VDERERTKLINKLREYSGAPIAVPSPTALAVEVPRPRLEREDEVRGTVRLRFEPCDVPPRWADRFNKDAGGPMWPTGLPIPRLDNGRIEVPRLRARDVARYVDALRRHFAATNRAIQRERPVHDARQVEAEAAARLFAEDLEEAQRFLDREFAAPPADLPAPAAPYAA
jgi:hypothetical protein